MKKTVSGIEIEADFEPSDKEIQKYIEYVIEKTNKRMRDIISLKLTLDGDNVDVDYVVREPHFERIRRINVNR